MSSICDYCSRLLKEWRREKIGLHEAKDLEVESFYEIMSLNWYLELGAYTEVLESYANAYELLMSKKNKRHKIMRIEEIKANILESYQQLSHEGNGSVESVSEMLEILDF